VRLTTNARRLTALVEFVNQSLAHRHQPALTKVFARKALPILPVESDASRPITIAALLTQVVL